MNDENSRKGSNGVVGNGADLVGADGEWEGNQKALPVRREQGAGDTEGVPIGRHTQGNRKISLNISSVTSCGERRHLYRNTHTTTKMASDHSSTLSSRRGRPKTARVDTFADSTHATLFLIGDSGQESAISTQA